MCPTAGKEMEASLLSSQVIRKIWNTRDLIIFWILSATCVHESRTLEMHWDVVGDADRYCQILPGLLAGSYLSSPEQLGNSWPDCWDEELPWIPRGEQSAVAWEGACKIRVRLPGPEAVWLLVYCDPWKTCLSQLEEWNFCGAALLRDWYLHILPRKNWKQQIWNLHSWLPRLSYIAGRAYACVLSEDLLCFLCFHGRFCFW